VLIKAISGLNDITSIFFSYLTEAKN